MAGAENDQTRCVDFECPRYALPFRPLPDSRRERTQGSRGVRARLLTRDGFKRPPPAMLEILEVPESYN